MGKHILGQMLEVDQGRMILLMSSQQISLPYANGLPEPDSLEDKCI